MKLVPVLCVLYAQIYAKKLCACLADRMLSCKTFLKKGIVFSEENYVTIM
uniref:Uncharacterized protein n=1 Tax=Octopus bimaculoides TaxID=37653 RepID=A0A0L8HF33_OCTBM